MSNVAIVRNVPSVYGSWVSVISHEYLMKSPFPRSDHKKLLQEAAEVEKQGMLLALNENGRFLHIDRNLVY